ncbi:MAG TPA: GNAT family N-acetyltransferase [Chloroflexota bacterium]|nr:GNAT family N-acetyltransferase [Chloroflexota bacterium]
MAESTAPLLNIVGTQVALGPLRRDLLPLYTRWLNDFAVTRTLAVGMAPQTLEAEARWYESVAQQPDAVHFTIYEQATQRPIGLGSLQHIDYRHGTAELGLLIGERACWGRGYGTEATRLLCDYGFTLLGLHNIWLAVYAVNARALRIYERAGFQLIGRRRAAWQLGGQRYDVLYLDCLRTEFESPVLRRWLDEQAAAR